ncbi:hypothetical protein NADFUDRAFT_82023 [Nadsonia fulvescens var. elongata DSM 6958]|uniref:TPR-like protein n=1 Tax=Nadsonia fulvescens var. elongata DSM 6958 TaxID=857566 RepID=A0A1E3PQ78_9ASCO|nr:hypothetical protein NADFUDRAFT_82023 [Nadsonia fulvescens var. elongata DSM 6958]
MDSSTISENHFGSVASGKNPVLPSPPHKKEVEHHYQEWLSKYRLVQQYDHDLQLWEVLLNEVSRLDGGLTKASSLITLELFRFSYDLCLNRFPLLFAYWIKYAELEFRLGFTEIASDVYERAIAAFPNSVDIWASYVKFKLLTCHDDVELTLAFELGAELVGLHFMSHSFWDQYINFEERSNGGGIKVLNLLKRIITIPLHQYAKYFDKYIKLSKKLAIKEIISPEVILKATKDLQIRAIKSQKISTATDGLTVTSKDPNSIIITKAELDIELRKRFQLETTHLYTVTQGKVAARWPFEKAMSFRPYYDVSFIDETQIVNWRKYLDFEEIECGTSEPPNEITDITLAVSLELNDRYSRIRALYDRCLVVTASMEEFWLRYTRWLIGVGDYDEARVIFQRGSLLLPIGRTELRHLFAKFEEGVGNYESAKIMYDNILLVLPFSIETIILKSSLIRLLEGFDAGISVLEQFLNNCFQGDYVTDTASTKRNLKNNPDLTLPDVIAVIIEVANSYRMQGYESQCRQVFEYWSGVLPNTNYQFWLAYLRFEMHHVFITNAEQKQQQQERLVYLIKTIRGLQGESMNPTEIKDLCHQYMVHLLENGSGKSAIETYAELDREINFKL